ncbi:SusC/RagA family TonB-linked outer membrane protein [Aestuariibaculum lutulentum]|uniref:SusC/RagA family TonB-linked outer membrane protein n=1 Tax=Aestuariibaculum lutulentum TaxID=2920935 RepID=A0ABS9RJB6_9FLAO|nr:SusC/RagA family TonB-linked outer membrane protein [Aestuariibaculum lutulentum]MCH4553049.1 SusC/RagA family TonB-linked outer membrane protein [Aestuariibaculum lutulentum]
MMRTLIFSWCFTVFSLAPSNTLSQNTKIVVDEDKAVTIDQVFSMISHQTDYNFIYSDDLFENMSLVHLKKGKIKIVDLLKECIISNRLNFSISEFNTIIIKKPKLVQETIRGVVKDQSGMPLPGVTILIKGTNKGTTTDFDGQYAVYADDETVLVFSYIGYKTTEIVVGEKTKIDVVLEPDLSELEEVVVTGIVERKRESFTGAVTTVSGEELKAIGNLNIIESLKTLDPSFVIVENNNLGSNPNRIPDIEVRGKTSVSTDNLRDEFGNNPNQPLFILDGFETTLRAIIDLDMSRVASITILKDASSTALYGAKAANGVIVVETVKPKSGKLRIMYNADLRLEMPDLTDYNLMDAEQKLEYEKLSGLYYSADATDQKIFDRRYNTILAEVKRGVDTYWLNEPLQVGITQGHSIYADGGDNVFTYGVGVNYRNLKGVMKGSNRETWGANIDLTYRKDKLNITNRLRVNGYDSNESPYGSFSNFAKANPYFRKTDEEGNITKFLDIDGLFGTSYNNPLYNGTLNVLNNTDNLLLTNNLQAIYSFNSKFRVQSGLQLSKGITTTEVFLPPEHTDFKGANYKQRGSYTNTRTDNFNFRLNTMATYAQVFNEKHSVTTNIRGEVEETSFDRLSVKAVGFPLGTNGNPAYAFSYQPDSKPSTAQSKYRRVNVLASANYAFDNTYFLDATYRLDGSTSFGSNEKYSPFWSAGAGVNLHSAFNINPEVMSQLRLRGNIGSVGNQGFGNLSSVTIYGFEQYVNVFGQAVTVNTLANPDLQWQNTLTTSVGIDMTMFGNRVNATFNAYTKKTDPLVVKIDLPSSTGVYGYPINAGYMDTRGIEAILRVSPIYNPKENFIWTLGLTASALKNEYGGFNNILESLNDQERQNASLIRYTDGYSPDDMWAVESLGIDPGTGREVFQTLDGVPTYVYNSDDVKVMGNSRPTVEGVVSSNLRFKNLSIGVNFRYRVGGDVLNTALFNKVENIRKYDFSNQDLRALTERWKEPGDEAMFKSITNFDATPISSRFIQRENVLIGESINLGYDFSNTGFVKSLGLSQLRLNAYMNDTFRLSSVKVERGIDYPFAQNVSFSLNARF